MAERQETGPFSDLFEALTPEEVRILYCLHVLDLTPEDAAAWIWPKAGEWGSRANVAYLAWWWRQAEEVAAAGTSFPKAAFLAWSGLPADPVTRPH